MANLVLASFFTLWLASLLLLSIPETNCELDNVLSGGNGRRLMQGGSSTATATASAQGDGTTTASAATDGCRVTAIGGAVSSASCSEETALGAQGAESVGSASSIGFRQEDDSVYCAYCPQGSGCEVCCCLDGRCVDRREAEEGTAKCPQPPSQTQTPSASASASAASTSTSTASASASATSTSTSTAPAAAAASATASALTCTYCSPKPDCCIFWWCCIRRYRRNSSHYL